MHLLSLRLLEIRSQGCLSLAGRMAMDLWMAMAAAVACLPAGWEVAEDETAMVMAEVNAAAAVAALSRWGSSQS